MVNLKWRDAMAVAGWHFTKTEQDIGWADSMRPDQLAALQRPYIRGGVENRPGRWRTEALAKAVTDACKGGDLAHIAKTLPGKAVANIKIREVETWEGTRKETYYTPSPKPKDVTEYQITAQAFAAWLTAPTQDETPSAHIAAWLETVGAGVKPQPQHEAAPVPTATPLIEQPTIWTDKRKREARAMLEKLKGEGKRDFHKQTAEHYQVSPQRLRDVLRDSAAPAPKKARGQNSVFDVQPSKVHRIK